LAAADLPESEAAAIVGAAARGAGLPERGAVEGARTVRAALQGGMVRVGTMLGRLLDLLPPDELSQSGLFGQLSLYGWLATGGQPGRIMPHLDSFRLKNQIPPVSLRDVMHNNNNSTPRTAQTVNGSKPAGPGGPGQ